MGWRDWDVFVTEFLPEASDSIADRAVIPKLTKTVGRLRADARRRVRAELVSANYEVHMLRLTQMLHERDWGRDRDLVEQQVAALAPKAFAASILGRAQRKVIKQGKRLDRSDLSGFHQLRISIKKLRYASELLAPLFANKSTRKYLSNLSDLQKILGQLNDAATAASLIDRLAPGHDDAAYLQAVAHLKGYAAAKSRFSLANFNSVWKKFVATEPFW